MYQWNSDKYSSNMIFPISGKLAFPDGCVYSTLLPAGIYEINGSRQEHYSPTEFTAHKDFVCDWDLRYEYIEVLRDTVYNHENLGSLFYSEMYDPKSKKYKRIGKIKIPISRYTTVRHSYWSYYLPAYVQDIQVQPFGAEGVSYQATSLINSDGEYYEELNTQKYTKARISVDYKGLARCSSAVMDQTVVPQIIYRKLPPAGYFWASDGSRVLDKEAPGKQEIKLKLTRSMKNVRKIPEAFFSLAGCVNNALVVDRLTGIPFPEGTLLYSPTNLQKSMTSAIGDDDRLWSFSFELNYNPIGWNRFQRPNNVIDTIVYNGAPLEIYQYADFHELGLDDMLDAASTDITDTPTPDDGNTPIVCPPTVSYSGLYEDYYVIWQDTTGYVYLLQILTNGTIVLYDVLLTPQEQPEEDPFSQFDI